MKKVKRWLKRIPRLSRPQRILRNFVCILIMAVIAWFLMGAPALTARWGFRRAERLNLLEPAAILDVVKLEDGGTMVVAESRWSYILWYDRFSYEHTELTIEEKREPVSLMMSLKPGWTMYQIPWVLMTDLPAARGEVEFTLVPDIADQYIEEEVHYLVEGERLNSGNFLFVIDCEKADYGYGPNDRVAMDVAITLKYLAMARYNVQQTCRVDIAVRLWDENGTLIYNEILKNGVEVIDNEN